MTARPNVSRSSGSWISWWSACSAFPACTSTTMRTTSRARSSGSCRCTVRARRRWTICCGGNGSSTSTRSCARQCARPSRACRSRISRSSTCRHGRGRSRPPARASSTTNGGESRRIRPSSTRSSATTRTTAVRRSCCAIGCSATGRRICRGSPGPSKRRTGRIRKPRSARIAALEEGLARYRASLLGGLPDDRTAWDADEHVRELVFELLDFHRRADKPAWWAMFARRDMTDDELIDDIECLGGLTRDSRKQARAEQAVAGLRLHVSRAGNEASRRQGMLQDRHDAAPRVHRRAR